MPAEHQQTAEQVVQALHSDVVRGLTTVDAGARLTRHGPNKLAEERPVAAWKKFLAQFRDVLVVLLLIATVISAALWWYERDAALPYEAFAISAVVLLNAVLGYVQQERAESAIAALRQMAAARAHVIRDSQPTSIPASEVVPGDILLAEDGDALTADVRVIDATALCVSEAALTGESLPVTKAPDAIAGD